MRSADLADAPSGAPATICREDGCVQTVAESQAEAIAEGESKLGVPDQCRSLGIIDRDRFNCNGIAQDEGASRVPAATVLDHFLCHLGPVGASDPASVQEGVLDSVGARLVAEEGEDGRRIEDCQARTSASAS